jgi:hypothetical protein
LRKLIGDYLNSLKVPFFDKCCTTAADSKPIRVGATSLETYNGTAWVNASAIPAGVEQSLSGAGAINVTSYSTKWTTTGADAGTLADGTAIGQIKKITLLVDGGDGTLTPANLAGGTTITFNDANDSVLLYWNGTDWVVIEANGVVVA